MPSEERGREGAEGRGQPASTHRGNPGQAASSSGCLQPHSRALHCLWIKLDNPESTLSITPLLSSASTMPGALEGHSGVKPAQDMEQSASVIST